MQIGTERNFYHGDVELNKTILFRIRGTNQNEVGNCHVIIAKMKRE